MANATRNERIQRMEKTLSGIAGRAVELTIRGEKAFTFSYAGRPGEAQAKLYKFFQSWADGSVNLECEYDEEFQETFIFLEIS
ncbi:hypothetical protein [Thalassoglobus polymorphus]|uniref:Uncharacterized protein n=1 Tax=Thalassoglobus polymorphus TaxID=2527994 RepID=A0A517QH49_9PLAN|nr:hypothetical protein [Thalassoglobus polymorphus]QDT30917.1 hypothetical protein Mal48_01460 [Thalassoglobus polymorphus]QDT30962.1 hypothetical protein Mal48_01910 [Thalassoglobus polymorphus]